MKKQKKNRQTTFNNAQKGVFWSENEQNADSFRDICDDMMNIPGFTLFCL